MLIHETILTTKPHSSIHQIKINTTEIAAKFLRKIWPPDILVRERCYAIYLNEANMLLTWMEVASVGVNEMTVDLKLILLPAIQISGCTRIILAHNHPSGSLKSSGEDRVLTFRLREAAQLFGIELVDHLIFSDRSTVSVAVLHDSKI